MARKQELIKRKISNKTIRINGAICIEIKAKDEISIFVMPILNSSLGTSRSLCQGGFYRAI